MSVGAAQSSSRPGSWIQSISSPITRVGSTQTLEASTGDLLTVPVTALGHASASVTLNTYAHMWATAADKTRAAAAGLMVATGG